MHELVKSALAAEKSGDRQRAHGYLKQALTENPKDVDAWLVLAATFEDPEKKRQCLNKVIQPAASVNSADQDRTGSFSICACPSTQQT